VAGRASGAKMGGDGGGLLISPEGVAPSRMVCLCYLPMHHKVQKKISSGTGCDAGSPGKKVVKQLCVCVCVWDRCIKEQLSTVRTFVTVQALVWLSCCSTVY